MKSVPVNPKAPRPHNKQEPPAQIWCARCGIYYGSRAHMSAHFLGTGRMSECPASSSYFKDGLAVTMDGTLFNPAEEGLDDQWWRDLCGQIGDGPGHVYAYVREIDGVLFPTQFGYTEDWHERVNKKYKRLPGEDVVVVADKLEKSVGLALEADLISCIVDERRTRNEKYEHVNAAELPEWLEQAVQEGLISRKAAYEFRRSQALLVLKKSLGPGAKRLSAATWMTPSMEAELNTSLSTPHRAEMKRRFTYTSAELPREMGRGAKRRKLLLPAGNATIDNLHEGGREVPNCERPPSRSRTRFSVAQLSPCIDLTDIESLYSLAERIVGVESVLFMGNQAELLRTQLYAMLPKGKKSQALDDFYRLLVPAVRDFHQAAFGCVASHALRHEGIIKAVVCENWNVSEIHTQHSQHVDAILRDLSTFRTTLTCIAQNVHLTPELNLAIWSAVLLQLFRTLVYANAEASKKCSTEGRALMLLNSEHLGRELEQLTGLHPLPHKAFLETFIRAFFLPRDSLDSWVVEHTEYNVTQVSALLDNMHTSPRKKASTKSMLMNLILDNLDS